MNPAPALPNKKQLRECTAFSKRLISVAVALSLVGQTLPVLAQDPPAAIAEPSLVQAQAPAVDATAVLASTTVSTTAPDSTSTLPIIKASSFPMLDLQRQLTVEYSRKGADFSETASAMDELRVVHPSAMQKNIGTQVALNVALLLLAGGVSFRGVDKNELIGRSPDDAKNMSRLKNPAIVQLVQEMQRQSSDWLSANPKTSDLKFGKPLVISSATWRLVYNSLSADDKTYQLKFEADIYKIRDKKSFFSNPSSTGKGCRYASNARPLDEWKANDYQAVVDLAPVVIAQCAKEFTAQLPDLLDLK